MLKEKSFFAAESCMCHSPTTKEFSNTVGSDHQIGGGQNGEASETVGKRAQISSLSKGQAQNLSLAF